ncbi:PotD/PotF family extracellular solute-binding protein [Pseudoflavonifractor sp. MSJ-37]|uniref:ABC transporter substrate-binding protein n=1 Tax=Pseudoflavonifractor sp. MSJ-37 TaxID=2841531 RepID=UPI001C11BB7A|nr:spermidine/putrescine ABC transporter substrate-binding protein [Pseudoflavonifractor sp. MSJ-37]MBU5434617.1 spermidine/putrescine ABC transporter substrate-binding protein [Pseudoflavonifractor sp. MSJ-37]
MKKWISLALAGASLMSLTACGGGSAADASNGVVNVYNWGEYIDESIFDDFTAQTGIKVNYTTFESNEALYGKLAGGATGYDVIIPSDYMIGQMIEEDMLEPLDFDNIPNFSDIDETLKNPAYDPENLYSVPYMFGTLGIIYNPTMVDEGEDMETWDVLWNEKYSGDILMFDNSRDTIGIALKKLGYSYNTTDEAEITAAVDELIAQRPLVQAYVMDDIFEKMEGGNAAIGVYYYGDYLTMHENNEDLAFAVPREGTNRYVDAMCIPKGCENKENAEAFINFMCSTDAGLKNCEATYYSSPLLSVREELDEELANDPYAYPDATFATEQCEVYNVLPAETRTLYNDQWVRLMNAG